MNPKPEVLQLQCTHNNLTQLQEALPVVANALLMCGGAAVILISVMILLTRGHEK